MRSCDVMGNKSYAKSGTGLWLDRKYLILEDL